MKRWVEFELTEGDVLFVDARLIAGLKRAGLRATVIQYGHGFAETVKGTREEAKKAIAAAEASPA